MADENANGSAAPADTAATTPTTPSNEDMVRDIMSFDPFGPATDPVVAGQDDTGKTVEPGSQDGGEVKEPEQAPIDPNAGTTPAQAPTQQGPTQREQELMAQVAALQNVIQQTKPQEKPKGDDKPAPRYNLGIPPQILTGLRSEDETEFAVAMHALINGAVNKVWNDVQDHLAKEVVPQFDQRISTVVEHGTQVQRVHNDFYGSYPHLKNPVLSPIVQQAALQVGRQWAQSGKPIQWNKEFADSVAALVHSVVPQPQQQQQQQQPAQQKRQQFVAQPGARPAAPKGNEFSELL